MDNKRKFERYDISAPARLEILEPEEMKDRMLLKSHDLSAGGVFIKTSRPIPEGSTVKMEFLLRLPEPDAKSSSPRATVIIVTGRIVRSTDEGMAILFNDDYDIISNEDPAIFK